MRTVKIGDRTLSNSEADVVTGALRSYKKKTETASDRGADGNYTAGTVHVEVAEKLADLISPRTGATA